MIQAQYNDQNLVVNILAVSFANNKSVNYIINQDEKRTPRIRKLMEYSFDVCYLSGDVFLSDDKKGCALLIFPYKKKTTLKLILSDIKLAFFCLGFSNLKKAMNREVALKKIQPNRPFYYLWFIGVYPNEQNKGTGSKLLEEVIKKSIAMKRTICLETSVSSNISWYERHGF